MRVLYKLNTMDLTAITEDKRSEVFDIRHLIGLTVQSIWTSSTAAATIKVEFSVDGETWEESILTQGIENDSGNKILEFKDIYYAYMRIFLDHSSGTVTTFKAHVCGKGPH